MMVLAGLGLLMSLGLSACSGVDELPYPSLGDVVRVEAPSLTPEERENMIRQLKDDKDTHSEETEQAIKAQ
jgi:hypothetical protein